MHAKFTPLRPKSVPKNQRSLANLGTATGVVDTTESAVININNSITSINAIITGDGPVAELMDGETINTIDGGVQDDIQDGRDALEEATELTESSSLEIAEWVVAIAIVAVAVFGGSVVEVVIAVVVSGGKAVRFVADHSYWCLHTKRPWRG